MDGGTGRLCLDEMLAFQLTRPLSMSMSTIHTIRTAGVSPGHGSNGCWPPQAYRPGTPHRSIKPRSQAAHLV